MRRTILAFFVLLFSCTAYSQVLAPIASFEIGAPLFISHAAGAFGAGDTGTSRSYSFGIGGEALWPDLLSKSFGISARLSGMYSTGQFSGHDLITGHEWKADEVTSLALSSSPIFLRVGPWISERFAQTILLNGANVTSPATESNFFHYGLAAGVGFDWSGFHPELNARLNLSQLSLVHSNALSVGISLSYWGHPNVEPAMAAAPTEPNTLSAPVRVRFLVNRSALQHEVPLERVETNIKEYRIGEQDSIPAMRQWIVESYQLPEISVLVEIAGGDSGTITVSKDTSMMFQTGIMAIPHLGLARDTIELDNDPEFLRSVSQLSIAERNTVVAEFKSYRGGSMDRDSLTLPPVDTGQHVATIHRDEQRFVFPLDSHRTIGLDSMIDKMKSHLQPGYKITIVAPLIRQEVDRRELMKHIEAALGQYGKYAAIEADKNAKSITVVLDR